MNKETEILKVMDYKDGNYFVGGIAIHTVLIMLGGTPGKDDIESLLKKAHSEDIDRVHRYLIPYIDHMNRHPVMKCPCCGKIVRIKQIPKKWRSNENKKTSTKRRV